MAHEYVTERDKLFEQFGKIPVTGIIRTGLPMTLSFDPGKRNTWWTLWCGRKLTRSNQLRTPTHVNELVNSELVRYLRHYFLPELGMLQNPSQNEVVIERYQHRGPGGGGTQSEVVNAIIFTIAAVARGAGLKVVLVVPSAHKNSYNKHHRDLYPRKIIKRLGQRHGTWRPRAERLDPCEHVMDSATLGAYRILKREGRI